MATTTPVAVLLVAPRPLIGFRLPMRIRYPRDPRVAMIPITHPSRGSHKLWRRLRRGHRTRRVAHNGLRDRAALHGVRDHLRRPRCLRRQHPGTSIRVSHHRLAPDAKPCGEVHPFRTALQRKTPRNLPALAERRNQPRRSHRHPRAETVGRSQRSRHSKWAFAELRNFVEYKSRIGGIAVKLVDPRNTSRTCAECGSCEEQPQE